jgi:hypothetical protein
VNRVLMEEVEGAETNNCCDELLHVFWDSE